MAEKEINIELLYKKLEDEGTLSEAEQDQVERWLELPEHRAYFEHLKDFYQLSEKPTVSEDELQVAWNEMQQKIGQPSGKIKSYHWWSIVAVAASIVILVVVGRLYIPATTQPEEVHHTVQINPGQQEAILELADGRLYNLKEMGQQQEKAIAENIHLNQGHLDYIKSDTFSHREPSWHKLIVPRGGEFQLTLEDGTKVWLNSESRLRYPEVFAGAVREVFLEGEAYFEVAKDALHPFIIRSGVQKVTVLGTCFGITCYPEDPGISTTLVQGKVAVEYPGITDQQYQLEPGVRIFYDHKLRTVQQVAVDVWEYVAWKDGKYVFTRKRLEDMLTTLARWYDFEVFYQNVETKEILFSGELMRFANFNDILRLIEKSSDVKFAVDKRVVVVTK